MSKEYVKLKFWDRTFCILQVDGQKQSNRITILSEEEIRNSPGEVELA